MGWTISHGNAAHTRRSYTSIAQLGEQLVHVLPGSDWRVLAPLFARRSEAWMTVSHRDAGRMARALRAAADHRKMPADWADLARELADAAQRAADARQSWEWS